NQVRNAGKEARSSRFLYNNPVGRVCLKLLTRPFMSNMLAWLIERKMSRYYISKFIRKYNIDMSRFKEQYYSDFNAFFTRKLQESPFPQEEARNEAAFYAPCDGKLSVYPMPHNGTFRIKNSIYSLADLLDSEEMAQRYANGTCLIFRLTPDDYHRYSYFDEGSIVSQKPIKGILHTVRPIAQKRYPVFIQNTRVCTEMQTSNFGTVTQVEVGAMLIGRIINHKSAGDFNFGEEKGLFEFGGSTIIVLLEHDDMVFSEELRNAMLHNDEYPVHVGEIIGCRKEA
ncbi:MAG: phosphatidylserine decarboxylase, partial [Firmicutes bacterium]|nr:phosphatidylserine decarboxylase [Bacillota bacterium]